MWYTVHFPDFTDENGIVFRNCYGVFLVTDFSTVTQYCFKFMSSDKAIRITRVSVYKRGLSFAVVPTCLVSSDSWTDWSYLDFALIYVKVQLILSNPNELWFLENRTDDNSRASVMLRFRSVQALLSRGPYYGPSRHARGPRLLNS